MTNPYTPSEAELIPDITEAQITRKRKISAVIFSAISLILNLGMHAVIPQFSEIFESFGADLPFLTQLVLSTYGFYAISFLICIVACFLICINHKVVRQRPKALFSFVIIGFMLSLILAGLSIVSMYLPIFKVSHVV